MRFLRNLLFLIAFCYLLFFSIVVEALEVIDDTGQKIKLNHPAQRIISLAPDLTELLFAAGAGDKIVGVMSGSNYPAGAKKIPIVANYNSIDTEKILTLKPDLVIAWTEGRLTQPLKKFGIPIYFSHQKKLTDIPQTLHKFGYLTGSQKIADQAAQDFLARYELLRKKYSQKKPVSVFFQVWPQPLITITKNNWIDDVIVLCGGKNIFTNLKGAAPEINLEAVIEANPDVIIGAESKTDWKAFWTKWPHLKAVQTNQLYSIAPDTIERASPRLLAGTKEVCKAIDKSREHDK